MSVVKYKDQNGEWKPISSVNGVGIANIEQTTVSQEAGGENIIKFTLTNGKEFEGVLYNGNDGKDYVLTDADKEEIAGIAAEAIGAEEKVLLWKNASPAEMSEQTIALGDVSEYSEYIIEYCESYNKPAIIRSVRERMGAPSVPCWVSGIDSSQITIHTRLCSLASDGTLTIGDNIRRQIRSTGTTLAENNNYVTILAVYGVKGA